MIVPGLSELSKLLNMETDTVNLVNYSHSTYEIVSKVAYLIGVPKRIFENPHEPPKMDVFSELELNKNARIVRNLCIARTAIERNFKSINLQLKRNFRSIFSIPEIPQDCLSQLELDGGSFIKKSNVKLSDHVIEINRILSDRINNCKSIFPIWLNWSYVRELFIMPDGLREKGTQTASAQYYANRDSYPYQVYLNMPFTGNGNILYSDKKFVTLLYEWHNDQFTDLSKVSNVGDGVIDNIYDFIQDSQKIVVVVDCENSDPYKLSAAFRQLSDEYTNKISTIILFDDIHTSSAWDILSEYTNVPVEHMLIERIKENKSLVDIRLTARTCQEFYENNVDSFIIVSSDSDYWGLISSLPKARFLAMIEYEKCGPDMKNALFNSGIYFCYLDDFYSGDTDNLKMGAMLRTMRRYLDEALHLNVNEMFEEILRDTRAGLSPAERQQFIEKYVKTLKLVVDEDGNASIEIHKLTARDAFHANQLRSV